MRSPKSLGQADSGHPGSVRTPVVVACVALLHVGALGAFFLIQGCVARTVNQPPERITMPPTGRPEVTPVPLATPTYVLPPRPEPVHAGRPMVRPGMNAAPGPGSSMMPTPAPLPAPGDSYVVKQGDSLSRIAHRHGVTANEIAQLNQISDRNMIRVGQKIVLPAHARARVATPALTPAPGAGAMAGGAAPEAGTVVVRSGDTLTHIARRMGTTVAALRAANQLTSDTIRVGQTLKLPATEGTSGSTPATTPAPTPAPVGGGLAIEANPVPTPAPAGGDLGAGGAALDAAPSTYRVKDGETLDDIARKFIVTKQELMRVNNLADGQNPRAGDTILIPWNTLP